MYYLGNHRVTRRTRPAMRRSFLGASILDPISISPGFTPSLPSPAQTPDASRGPFSWLKSLVPKGVDVSFNPNQAVSTAQRYLKPGQVSYFVDLLRKWGVEPTYQGVPITGGMASTGYRIYGMNIGQYLPWIIGGGAVLLALPMLMSKKRR
jgi:hypothetical protein